MTTDAPPLPAPAAEECHRGTLLEGRESSEAFPVGNGDTAKNVALTTSPDDSWGRPLDGALISFDEDPVVGHPPTSVQKDGPLDKSALALLTPSETFKMAGDDQGQNGGHFVLQGKIPDPSVEQLEPTDTSGLSDRGEDGSRSVCQGEMPEPFSDVPNPVERAPGREEERPHNRRNAHPAATADSLEQLEPSDTSSEPGQGDNGSPCGHEGDTSEVRSELQPSDSNISGQRGVREETWEADRHGVASESPAQPEAAGGPEETACGSAENGRDCLLPQSPDLLLQEGSCHLFPGHDPIGASSAEPQGTFDAADVKEGLKPGGQEMTETGEGESVTGDQKHQPVALGKDLVDPKGQLLEATPVSDSQGREAPVAQDHKADGTFQALASTGTQSSVGTGCQQRAAGTGCDNMFPEAVPPLSPVATTGDSLGPAHEGLAPGRDEGEREGPNGPESRATAGSENKPLGEAGAETVLESEQGEEAAGDAGPGSTTAREPAGAPVLTREVPSLENGIDPAMVLACAPESLDPRYKEEPQDLSSIQAKPRGGLLFDSKEPADTEDQVSTTDTICANSNSDELPGAGGPSTDWMEDDAVDPENRRPGAETPIEREIRLHLEREELLRRQRGLAGSRGAPEYVEVRIRPFLSQSVPPSPLAKEKELQWAGVQMQREIRRECQREEDLVQLGKVRGAYDRGTPRELQEKKMIFEQAAPEPPAPAKTVPGSSEGTRERPCAETDGAAGPVAQAPSERPSTANPFFSLRAKSPQSLLEREVQEAQEREWELQRQRRKIYGSAVLTRQPEEALGQDADVPFQPERPPCKKLDVTWPPPSPSEPCQVNGLHQLERSPRSRQKSALIQRWESGTVGNQESQD